MGKSFLTTVPCVSIYYTVSVTKAMIFDTVFSSEKPTKLCEYYVDLVIGI